MDEVSSDLVRMRLVHGYLVGKRKSLLKACPGVNRSLCSLFYIIGKDINLSKHHALTFLYFVISCDLDPLFSTC